MDAPWRKRTGKVLMPLDEQERKENEQAADEYLAGIMARCINDDAPFRYDPPEKPAVTEYHGPDRFTVGVHHNGEQLFGELAKPVPAPKAGYTRTRSINTRRGYRTWAKR